MIEAIEIAASRRRFLLAWALALLFGASSSVIAASTWRGLPHPHPMEELSYYPSGDHLRQVALGHHETAADLAWLRAVQYYGEHRNTDMRFARMTHVFEILTSLAPGFVPAYVFGAFALAQEGGDFPGAERLMLKGIEANPTSGELAFQLGFLYYVRPDGRSLELASEYFEQSSRQLDAPPQSARFAAYSRQHSGDLLVAYQLWRHVAETSPNRYLAERAESEMGKIRDAIRTGHAELAVRKLGTPQVIVRREK